MTQPLLEQEEILAEDRPKVHPATNYGASQNFSEFSEKWSSHHPVHKVVMKLSYLTYIKSSRK